MYDSHCLILEPPCLKKKYKFHSRLKVDDLDLTHCTGAAAIDYFGNFHVYNKFDDQILVFDKNGTLLKSYELASVIPTGFAFDPEGHLVVVDQENAEILVVSPTGEILRKCSDPDGRPTLLQKPSCVAIDAVGTIFVSDTGTDTIQVFHSSGRWERRFGTSGRNKGLLSEPIGLAIDASNGDVIVCERSNHRVQIFSHSGCSLRTVGSRGSNNGNFLFPWGVTIDQRSRIVVGDQGNSRIQIFSKSGDFLRTVGSPGHRDGFLWNPILPVLDSEGNLIIVEKKGLQVFKASDF